MNTRRLESKRAATAGIVAALILFAMLFTAGASYLVFTNTANQQYGQTLAQQVGGVQGTATEAVQLTTVLLSSNGDLGFYVNNTSSVNVNMTAVIVQDSSGNVLQCDGNRFQSGLPSGGQCSNTSPALPITVNRGKGSATIDTGYKYGSGTDIIKVMTKRGNAFYASFPQTGPPYAAQAQSIGALTANLQTFKWISPSGTQQSGGFVSGFPTIGLAANTQGYVPITLTNNQVVAPIGIDNTATGYCGNTNQCSASITTYNSNDLIYVSISDSLGTGRTPSVSDDARLQWTQRAYKGVSNTLDVFTFYAVAPSTLSSDNIYANLGGYYTQTNMWMIVLAISNANTVSPFDPNLASAPTASNGNSRPATLTFSTTNTNDLVLGTVLVGSHTPSGAGGAWYFIGCCSGYQSLSYAGLEYQTVSSAGSWTPSFSWGYSNDAWAEIGDAVQQGFSTAATPNPFQEQITWNPSAYTNYESPDLGNIRFCADSGCTQLLYSWLESCTPSCSNSATSATAWVRLTSSIAGSGGTLTIYMGFQSSCTEFDGSDWGEAPQLSSSYGLYDNGANVFAAYFNGGTSTSSFSVRTGNPGYGLSTANGVSYGSSTITALKLTGYHGNDIAMVYNTQLSNSPMVAESNFESMNYGTDSGVVGFADNYPYSNVQNAIGTNTGWQSAYFNQDYMSGGTIQSGVNNQGSSSAAWLYGSTTYPGASVGAYSGYVAPQLYSTSGGYSGAASANPIYQAAHLYLGFVFTTNQGAQAYIYYNWVRARMNPPNGVMPYTTFGSFVPPGGTGYLIFSVTFTDQDQQGRGVTLWPDSSVAIITTTTGGQTSSVVTNFYIIDGVSGGTNPTGIVAYNSSKDFVHLPFRTATTVYFAASAPKGSSMVLLNLPGDPFQILLTLTGEFDDLTLYGQTIPFPAGVITKAVASLTAYSGPSSNPPSVGVTGGCFVGGSKAIVGWIGADGKVATLTTFKISASGTISNVNFQVPSVGPGYYTVIVTDFENSLFFVFHLT